METFKRGPVAPTMTEQEAMAKLHEAVAYTRQQLMRGKKQFSSLLELAEARRAHAEASLAEARELASGLAAQAETPDGARALAMARIMVNIYGAARRMMAIEAECHRKNLALLDWDSHEPPAKLSFQVPARDLTYLEARAYMDLHVAMAFMHTYLDGVDMVLRATVGESIVVPQRPEEAEARSEVAAALKAAMAEDRDLATTVTHMGAELYDAYASVDWGKSVFAMLDGEGLSEAARRPLLEDPDWALVNAKVLYLCTLAEKAAPFPALAPFFPPQPDVPLPYAAPDADAQAGWAV